MYYALQMMKVFNWSWRCRGWKEHEVEEDMHKVMNVMMEVVMKMVVVLKMMELMVDCIATLVRDGNVDGTQTFGLGDIEKAAKKDKQQKM